MDMRRRNGTGTGQPAAESVESAAGTIRDETTGAGDSVEGVTQENAIISSQELAASPEVSEMVTSSAVEAGGEVQANPFWSQRAQEELRLRAARPSTLDDTPALASNASTELRRFEEIPPLPAGEPQSFAPQGMTESTASPEPNPGLRPGERQVLTEMKNLISTLIGQNRDLCGQNADLQQRLERLEGERSNSQAWRSAPSGGGAEASETLDQGWRASTWGSVRWECLFLPRTRRPKVKLFTHCVHLRIKGSWIQ